MVCKGVYNDGNPFVLSSFDWGDFDLTFVFIPINKMFVLYLISFVNFYSF